MAVKIVESLLISLDVERVGKGTPTGMRVASLTGVGE